MKLRIAILSTALVGFSQIAFGQIKEEKLILDRKRVPEVRKIEKKKTPVATVKNYPPQDKKTEDSLNLRYTITDIPAVSDFKTSAIQPVDATPNFRAAHQDNYFRIGGGNYGKVLGDVHLGTALEKFDVGVDAHYLMTSGLKKDYPWDSKSNRLDGDVFINYFGDKGKANVELGGSLENYNFYGIYALAPSDAPDLRQRVTRAKVNAYYDFYANNYLDYVTLKFGGLGDYFDSRETSTEAKIALTKDILTTKNSGIKLSAQGDIGFHVLNSQFEVLKAQEATNFIFEFNPTIKFEKGENFLALGVNLNAVNERYGPADQVQKENDFNVYPEVHAQYAFSPEMKIYAGVDGESYLNSYSEQLQHNPYLAPDQLLKASNTDYHIYLGVKGDLMQNLKYDLNAGYTKEKDMLLYKANGLFDNVLTLNRSAYNYANTFSAVYDDGEIAELSGNVYYSPLQNLTVNGGLHLFKYKMKTQEEAYNRPNLMAELGAKYEAFNQKLKIDFRTVFAGNRRTNYFEVATFGNTPTAFTQTEYTDGKVKGYADVNLSAEYQIHKNFSIFAIGNNLLDNKYSTYFGYKVLGAQITGGFKISF